jgi:two-component system, NarL family, response regulator DevR
VTEASVNQSSQDARDAADVRVFIVDDHEIVRRGVRDLINSSPGLFVVGEAATAAEALSVAPALRPRVAILDVRLPDGDGVAVCRELRSRLPELHCLMLTTYSDDDALYEAVMAGAAGYLLKQVRGADLVSAVRAVAAGESILDPASTARMLDRLRAPLPQNTGPDRELTAREHHLLDLIGQGLTNREIADRTGLTEKTVKNYVSRLLQKLGMARRAQIAAFVTERRVLRERGNGWRRQ